MQWQTLKWNFIFPIPIECTITDIFAIQLRHKIFVTIKNNIFSTSIICKFDRQIGATGVIIFRRSRQGYRTPAIDRDFFWSRISFKCVMVTRWKKKCLQLRNPFFGQDLTNKIESDAHILILTYFYSQSICNFVHLWMQIETSRRFSWCCNHCSHCGTCTHVLNSLPNCCIRLTSSLIGIPHPLRHISNIFSSMHLSSNGMCEEDWQVIMKII